jgi:hypothetical protein
MLVVVAVAMSFVWARELYADEPRERTSSLSWVRLEGAESCIGTQDLAQAVEQRLQRKVFVSAAEADVSVEGHVSRVGARWRAVLTIRDSNGALLGTRELDSAEKNCSALDEGLAFVVSVLIDPDAELRQKSEDEKREPAVIAPEPTPRVVVRKERVLVPVPVEQKPRKTWGVEAGLGVAAGVGLLPNASVGVMTAIVIDPPFPLALFLTGALWRAQSVDAERSADAKISLAHGGAALCPLTLRSDRIVYRLCAGALFGTLQSQGEGFDIELSNEKLVAHAFLPNRVTLRLAGPLAATAGVAPLVPIAKTELTYRSSDGRSHTLFEPSPIAVTADLGLAVVFP